MNPEVAKNAIKYFGLEPIKIAPVATGYRNSSYYFETADGASLNLIVYKREADILARIKNANYVSNYLASCNFPARASADPRILELASENSKRYAALYNWLPCETIAWEAYTMKHLKSLGEMMGKMHAELAALARANLPLATDELLDLSVKMAEYFFRSGVKRAIENKLGLKIDFDLTGYELLLSILSRAKIQQPLHLDFVRGNILFDPSSSEISGVLDFEKAAYGAPAIDLARTLAFLLIDCKYKSPEKTRKYFLESGYKKRGGQKIANSRALETLVEFFWLHDFYKFLRHNPYEFLRQNEHFMRTRNFLLAAKLIKNVKI